MRQAARATQAHLPPAHLLDRLTADSLTGIRIDLANLLSDGTLGESPEHSRQLRADADAYVRRLATMRLAPSAV